MLRIAASLLALFAVLIGAPAAAHATVSDPVVTVSISVADPAIPMAIGDTRQFTATAHHKSGATSDVTNSATWASDAPSKISVDAAGLALANAVGTAKITAAVGTRVSPGIRLTVSRCTIIGTNGADVLNGTSGADIICGLGGDDEINGDDGADDIEGGAGIDTINGGLGIDTLRGGADGDQIDGGDDGDRLYGDAGDDSIVGGAGNDLAYGGLGSDTLAGGDGLDQLRGDGGNDTLDGEAGDDRAWGGTEDDTVNGGSEHDQLFGDAGSDSLSGGTGDDRLNPGADDDASTDGGDGTDTLVYDNATGSVVVYLSDGYAEGAAGTDKNISGVENVTGSAHDDTLIGDDGPNLLNGGAGTDGLNALGGADVVYAGSGSDLVYGGEGNDHVLGQDDNDEIYGEAGDDSVNGGNGDDLLDAGVGTDSLTGEAGADDLRGGDENDTINPGLGNDTVDGGAGTDTLAYSTNVGAMTIDLAAGTSTGGGGNDVLQNIESATGASGDDTIFGDGGVNILSGRLGSDTIDGRGGIDGILGGGDDFLHGGDAGFDVVNGQAGTDTCGENTDSLTDCELSFNVAPTLTIVDNTNAFTEGDAAKAVDPTLTLTDDEANTDGATVTIGTGFESGKDFLSVSGVLPAGVTASYVAPTLTISGTATVAQYQAILRGVRFENTSQDPSTADRTISFTVTDGELSDDSGNVVTMSVLRVNDAPVADTDSFSGGNHGIRMRVGTTHADAHEVEVSGNVLDGDVDVDTPTANLTTTPGTITSTDCASANPACANNVTMASDGTFIYDPPAGGDSSDSFTYTVEDNDTGDSDGTEDTHTNTVTIGMSGTRAWFVNDDAPAGGRGVSHAPLQSLAQLATGGNLNEEDGTGDRILVYSGNYATGIDLEAGQWIVGEPHGLNIGGTQFVAAGGSKPAMSSITGHVVQLHSGGNEVQDLALGSTPAGSYSLQAPAGVGSFTVADTDIANGTGGALHIADGTPSVTLGTLSSTGSSNNGVRIVDTEGGSVSSTGGTLSNAASADLQLFNSNTTVTLGSAISDDLGQLINVNGGSGDVTYNGTITDGEDGDGDGIAITSTSGDHNFTKSVLVSVSPTQSAFSMTNSASGSLRMVPTAATNRLASTTGTALNVTSTPIHADGIKFERINSQGLSKYGINLQNTGLNGRLEIAGTGTAASGGTISGKNDGSDPLDAASDTSPSAGIYIENGRGPSLAWMKLSGFGDFAIKGQTVNSFNMANTVIDGSLGNNGSSSAPDEGAVSFDELTGTGATISASTIKQGWENDLRIKNDSGTLNRLTVSGTQFGSSSAEHNDSVQIEANANAVANVTVQTSTFTSARGDQLQAVAQDAAQSDFQILNNTVTNSHPSSLGGGMLIAGAGDGHVSYALNNNTINGAKGSALVAEKLFSQSRANTGTLAGTISGNQVGTSGVAGSGSANGSGIFVREMTRGRHSVVIANNTLRQYRDHGMAIYAGGSATSVTGLPAHDGDLNLTITGNNVAQPNGTGAGTGGGIYIQAGTNSPDQYDVCVTANNNTANGSAPLALGSTDFLMFQRFDTKFYLPGYTGINDGAVTAPLNSYFHPRFVGGVTALGGNTTTQYIVNTASATGGYFNTAGGAACIQS